MLSCQTLLASTHIVQGMVGSLILKPELLIKSVVDRAGKAGLIDCVRDGPKTMSVIIAASVSEVLFLHARWAPGQGTLLFAAL